MSEPATQTDAPAVALAAYVRSSSTDSAFVAQCAAEAEAIVAEALRPTAPEVSQRPATPATLRARAVLEVGAELFNRRGLRNGVATFGTGDGDLQPVHVPRDPMHLARSILFPYLGGPFA